MGRCRAECRAGAGPQPPGPGDRQSLLAAQQEKRSTSELKTTPVQLSLSSSRKGPGAAVEELQSQVRVLQHLARGSCRATFSVGAQSPFFSPRGEVRLDQTPRAARDTWPHAWPASTGSWYQSGWVRLSCCSDRPPNCRTYYSKGVFLCSCYMLIRVG